MTGPTHAVCLVADDLTGAMDTAHGFAARGRDTSVVAVPSAGPDELADRPGSSILAVNTDTRYDAPEAASEAVSDVVRAVPARTVYKKVDSTLRGNVGAETDAALTASGADFALVAPAFPAAGRTTRGGVHYVDGTPVDETEYAADEKGPTSPTLAALFDGVDRPVEHLPADVVASGADAVTEVLSAATERHDRAPVVVCDADSARDLATIADAGTGFDALYVGSGGLAEHVAVPGSAGDARPSTAVEPGAPLAVVGSVSETTLAQLERVPAEWLVELDPVGFLAEPGPEDAAARSAAERIASGRPAVLTAATDRETVERTTREGRGRGLDPIGVRDRVASGLASTAAAVLDTQSPSGLFYTGGDVAVACLRSLDARTVTLTGESVTTGIPLGRHADGVASGTPLITKAGGFGERSTVVNCLERLGGNDD